MKFKRCLKFWKHYEKKVYRGTNNRDFQKRAEGKTKGWESFIS